MGKTTKTFDRLAVDANAVIELIRSGVADPPPFHSVDTIFLPLPVLGELFAGQHDLPLLTNDGGFDTLKNLRVLHW